MLIPESMYYVLGFSLSKGFYVEGQWKERIVTRKTILSKTLIFFLYAVDIYYEEVPYKICVIASAYILICLNVELYNGQIHVMIWFPSVLGGMVYLFEVVVVA